MKYIADTGCRIRCKGVRSNETTGLKKDQVIRVCRSLNKKGMIPLTGKFNYEDQAGPTIADVPRLYYNESSPSTPNLKQRSN